jgi:N6-L-threonylcarbamoyladenine synthase
VRDLGDTAVGERRADLAASYQRAIVLALARRLRQAAEAEGLSRLAVVGGVAANSELRAALPDAVVAPLSFCTDNAAMIASAARYADPLPPAEALVVDAYATAR